MQEETINQEAELETAEGTTEEVVTEEKPAKKDPLDEIQDVETLRAEAKKYRSITNRVATKKEDKETTPVDTSNFVTKRDLETRNEKSAKAIMTTVTDNDTDAVKAMKQAIADNYDDISAYYTNRSGREEPEQIAKDLRAAYLIWADEQGKELDLSQLAVSNVIKSGGTKPAEKTPEEDPRFKKPLSPKEWYGKK